jgi:hypothetical protein
MSSHRTNKPIDELAANQFSLVAAKHLYDHTGVA